ncbi:hypothetical protein BJ993_001361 [Nocardioides aromaticivorans]|uniref:Uncharacterized protein n=1 Tax=Nocardioides aromaticivorans TaxID=200618 RepID=A0A7Z0CK26_9ACTN|nr:hypothetical protein [Nocardioides aromaticivorans]NYI44281.1 hypothetical protein [Nocardioides aromaticivorans]
MFEMLHEQRVRQDIDDRVRRASRQRLVARAKAARSRRTTSAF